MSFKTDVVAKELGMICKTTCSIADLRKWLGLFPDDCIVEFSSYQGASLTIKDNSETYAELDDCEESFIANGLTPIKEGE